MGLRANQITQKISELDTAIETVQGKKTGGQVQVLTLPVRQYGVVYHTCNLRSRRRGEVEKFFKK